MQRDWSDAGLLLHETECHQPVKRDHSLYYDVDDWEKAGK